MWLVLASPHDAAARWACEGLRRRGLAPVLWVDGEALANAAWSHALDDDGVDCVARLPDGQTLDGRALRGVLNRLDPMPQGPLRQAHAEDRDYAQQELFALLLSWLHALPAPLLNRATPHGLAGAWRHASEWALLAGRAGLPAAHAMSCRDEPALPRAQDAATTRAIVLDGAVHGPALPPAVREALVRLSELAETPLLGVELRHDGEWRFVGASACPDLRLGGEPLLDALARALGAPEEGATP